jgi:hypothetical protein
MYQAHTLVSTKIKVGKTIGKLNVEWSFYRLIRKIRTLLGINTKVGKKEVLNFSDRIESMKRCVKPCFMNSLFLRTKRLS